LVFWRADYSFLGILGIYIARIFVEAKHRPYAIVRHVYSAAKEEPIDAHPLEKPEDAC